jgi:hypothetical protein
LIGVVEDYRDTLRSLARKREFARDADALRTAATVCTELLRAIKAEDAKEAYGEFGLLRRTYSDMLPWVDETRNGLRDIEHALRRTIRKPRIPRAVLAAAEKASKKRCERAPRKAAKKTPKTTSKKTPKKTKRKTK